MTDQPDLNDPIGAPGAKLAIPVLALLSALGIAYSVYLVFYGTPLEFGYNEAGKLNGSSLFFNQKIFYFHVAHAFWLFGAVFVSGASSIAYLVTRKAKWDDLASAATDVSVAFGAVVLITGSVWAKAAWDVWWHWEPRLTMSLLLWLVLVGYVLVRRFAGAGAERIAAGMAIFGMVGVPFIYKMVGSDSHPAAGGNGVVLTLAPEMKGPFWICVVSFLCWFLVLVLSRVASTRAERELRELREHGLDLGVLQ
ncbi:MAG TPA: cytochrome c biogenesis protein CcsA [Kofleriaceae bacterium]|jgi:heme exporter protein C|nr:cytochrome c biogenesis protein CcsA [Kofleriaceae bacterium]